MRTVCSKQRNRYGFRARSNASGALTQRYGVLCRYMLVCSCILFFCLYLSFVWRFKVIFLSFDFFSSLLLLLRLLLVFVYTSFSFISFSWMGVEFFFVFLLFNFFHMKFLHRSFVIFFLFSFVCDHRNLHSKSIFHTFIDCPLKSVYLFVDLYREHFGVLFSVGFVHDPKIKTNETKEKNTFSMHCAVFRFYFTSLYQQ